MRAQKFMIFAVCELFGLEYLLHVKNIYFAFLTVLHSLKWGRMRGQSDSVHSRVEGCVI